MHDQTTSTPRTNAVAHFGHDSATYISKMTDVARQLERELAQAQDRLEKAKSERENHFSELDSLLTQSLDYADKAGRWRQVADELAGALRIIRKCMEGRKSYGLNSTITEAIAAYDQLKEASK